VGLITKFYLKELFIAVLAFYHYSAVKVQGPFLRAGSILPPPLLSVKGSTPRVQKTPPLSPFVKTILLPRNSALPHRVCNLSIVWICRVSGEISWVKPGSL
jgi:hypothetical protein